MSTMHSGRWPRRRCSASTAVAAKTVAGLSVDAMITSTSSATSPIAASATGSAPTALASRRLDSPRDVVMMRAPWSCNRSAARRLIFPAPTSRTPLPSRSPQRGSRALHRHLAEARGASAQRGFRAHALGGRNGAAHDVVEARIHCPRLGGHTMCALELPEHLRLTDHHALETARDPKHVLRGLAVLEGDHVALEPTRAARVEVAGQSRRDLRAEVIGADDIEIGAIAGGKDCRAEEARVPHEVPQRRCSARRWDGRSLPHSQWSGAKAQPGGYQSHHERV